MLNRIKKHLPKIIVGHGILFGSLVLCAVLTLTFTGQMSALLATATSSVSTNPISLYFMPYFGDILNSQNSETSDIDLDINARVPINALEVTIKYPPESLEIVAINKKHSFMDLWTEDTVIKESAGEIHFSGGTTRPGGLTGTSTVVTLTVRAKKDAKAGDAKLAVSYALALSPDGLGSEVKTTARTFSYTIKSEDASPVTPSPTVSVGGSMPSLPQRPTPNPDLNADGAINLIDVSIMTVRMLMPYDSRYDLNIDGKVGLADLSIIFSAMPRPAFIMQRSFSMQ